MWGEARGIRGALGDDHGVRAHIAKVRVDGVRMDGHGDSANVGAFENAEAGLATAASDVTVTAVRRSVAEVQRRDGDLSSNKGVDVVGGLNVVHGRRSEPLCTLIGILNEIVEAEIDGWVKATGADGGVLGVSTGRVKLDAVESGLDRGRDVESLKRRVAPRRSACLVSSGGGSVAQVSLAVKAAVIVLGSGGGSRAGDGRGKREALSGTRTLGDVVEEIGVVEAKVILEIKVGLERGDGVGALALDLEHEGGRFESFVKGERQGAGGVDGRRKSEETARGRRQIEKLGSSARTEKLFLHLGEYEEMRDGEEMSKQKGTKVGVRV